MKNITLFLICINVWGCAVNAVENVVNFKNLDNYSEYKAISNSQIIIRSWGYMNPTRKVVRYNVEKDPSNNSYFVTYFLGRKGDDDISSDIKYLQDNTLEVLVTLDGIGTASNIYYKDYEGAYIVHKGDDFSWKKYLKEVRSRIGEYGDPR